MDLSTHEYFPFEKRESLVCESRICSPSTLQKRNRLMKLSRKRTEIQGIYCLARRKNSQSLTFVFHHQKHSMRGFTREKKKYCVKFHLRLPHIPAFRMSCCSDKEKSQISLSLILAEKNLSSYSVFRQMEPTVKNKAMGE